MRAPVLVVMLFGAAATIAAGVAAAPAATASTRRAHAGGGPVFSLSTRRRTVALSFDDGPDPRWTPTVLRLLAQYRDSATFFDVGLHALAHPDLVTQEVRQGMSVEDHTLTHADLTALSTSGVRAEIADGGAALMQVGAPKPVEFRPPYGFWDARVERMSRALGYRMVLWHLCLEHYIHLYGVRAGVDRLVGDVRPGSIILAHDGGIANRHSTLAALPLLLRQLHARGYRVVAVDALSSPRTSQPE